MSITREQINDALGVLARAPIEDIQAANYLVARKFEMFFSIPNGLTVIIARDDYFDDLAAFLERRKARAQTGAL